MAAPDRRDIRPIQEDSYVIAHRWSGLRELTDSREDLAPRRIAELWRALTRGEYPEEPIDYGI